MPYIAIKFDDSVQEKNIHKILLLNFSQWPFYYRCDSYNDIPNHNGGLRVRTDE